MSTRRLLAATATFWLALSLPAAPTMAAEAAPALRLYRDQATGAVGVPPPAATRRAVAAPETGQPTAETSAAPAAQPVQAPAGGMRLRFDHRYRAAITRHAGDGGVPECVQAGGSAQ